MKYLLQKSHDTEFGWVLTDTEHGVVCRFIEGDFNGTQKFTILEDVRREDVGELPRIAREMGEWLAANHYEIVFSSPHRIVLNARKSVGEQLKAAREAKGYTLRYLAKLTGIANNHISRIEAGRYNATIDTIAVIAAALGAEIKISLADELSQ